MTENTHKKRTALPPVHLSLWQDVWIALSKPRFYLRWAFQPFARSLTYLVYLNMLLAVVFTAYLHIIVRPALLAAADWVEESLPLMTYTDGVLSVENDQATGFTDGDQVFVKIDPTQSAEDEPHIDSFYESGFLVTSDQVLIKNPETTNVYELDEVLPFNFSLSGADAAQWIRAHLIYAYFLVPVVLFFALMASKLLHTAVFTLFLYLFSGMKYPFKQLWSLAIYALTPALAVGYLTLLFQPIPGLYTAVFLLYYTAAYMHYSRFQQLKQNTITNKQ